MDLIREGRPERQALDKIRSDIEVVRAEIDEVIHADAADDDLMKHCRRAVRSELEGPRARQFDSLRRADALVDHLNFPNVPRWENAKLPPLSWAAVILMLGEDRAVQSAYDAAKRGATKPPGLQDADRAKRLAELRDMQRKVERAEEIEILNLEAAGFAVLRRENIDPAVIFDVWGTYTEPAEAAAA
jgi:hypothetical protein